MESITLFGKKRSLRRIYAIGIVLILVTMFLTEPNPGIGFKEVNVHEGDTLETLIGQNTNIPHGGDIRNLVSKTKEVNDTDLSTIYPGQKITIAVYK